MSPGTEIIYGLHSVRHALQHSPHNILEMWVQDTKKESQAMAEIIKAAGSVSVQFATKQTLDKLARYGRHQGVVIRKRREKVEAGDLEALLGNPGTNELPLFLVLDGVQDPHNLGACLRTADAAGVKAVIIPKARTASLTATVSKVASGAAENVPLIEVTNLARTLRQLQEAGIWVIGTADDAPGAVYQADLNRPLALVMGGEQGGLRENTRKHCDLLVSIPMAGIVESLNVSVATGICLFEAVRQRQYSS
jgi:23S rRNA (guanosine2251-2'-O)-methyltransferase